jgi:hypothetical protein
MAQRRPSLPGRGASNRNTELGALNEIIKRIQKEISVLVTGIAIPVGASTLAEQVTQTTALNSISANTLSLLNNLVASQDVEILLVRDTGNITDPTIVVQQIREYDQGTGLWTTRYEKVDGSAYIAPELVGPLEYLDPSAVLSLILTELQSIDATLDVDLSTRASEVTVAALQTLLTTIDAVLDTIKLDTANLDVALSTVATETTLATVSTNVADIEALLARNRLTTLETMANDLTKTFAFLDPGTTDERVSTIIYSGTTVPATANVTKTFVYAGVSPNFRVLTITLS